MMLFKIFLTIFFFCAVPLMPSGMASESIGRYTQISSDSDEIKSIAALSEEKRTVEQQFRYTLRFSKNKDVKSAWANLLAPLSANASQRDALVSFLRENKDNVRTIFNDVLAVPKNESLRISLQGIVDRLDNSSEPVESLPSAGSSFGDLVSGATGALRNWVSRFSFARHPAIEVQLPIFTPASSAAFPSTEPLPNRRVELPASQQQQTAHQPAVVISLGGVGADQSPVTTPVRVEAKTEEVFFDVVDEEVPFSPPSVSVPAASLEIPSVQATPSSTDVPSAGVSNEPSTRGSSARDTMVVPPPVAAQPEKAVSAPSSSAKGSSPSPQQDGVANKGAQVSSEHQQAHVPYSEKKALQPEETDSNKPKEGVGEQKQSESQADQNAVVQNNIQTFCNQQQKKAPQKEAFWKPVGIAGIASMGIVGTVWCVHHCLEWNKIQKQTARNRDLLPPLTIYLAQKFKEMTPVEWAQYAAGVIVVGAGIYHFRRPLGIN